MPGDAFSCCCCHLAQSISEQRRQRQRLTWLRSRWFIWLDGKFVPPGEIIGKLIFRKKSTGPDHTRWSAASTARGGQTKGRVLSDLQPYQNVPMDPSLHQPPHPRPPSNTPATHSLLASALTAATMCSVWLAESLRLAAQTH